MTSKFICSFLEKMAKIRSRFIPPQTNFNQDNTSIVNKSDTSFIEVKNKINEIPEDSVLKRHYLAMLAAKRESITNPYPTDSVLRRHYESMHNPFAGKSIKSKVGKIKPKPIQKKASTHVAVKKKQNK